jgi:hypothetical protein
LITTISFTMFRQLAGSGQFPEAAAAAAAAAASSAAASRLPSFSGRHRQATRSRHSVSIHAAVAGSSGAVKQNKEQSQQQLDATLLPALGAGRVPRSEQLKRQELAKSNNSGSKRRAAVNVAKLLTNQIAAASSLDQLHDIVAAHGSYLDHIHVAKLLARTSQLAGSAAQQQLSSSSVVAEVLGQQQQQRQADDQQVQLQQQMQQQQLLLLYNSLTSMMVQRLRHSTPQSFVPAVAALGRLATIRLHPAATNNSSSSMAKPSQQQLEQLAAKAGELATTLTISQLTVVLWGLAKAGAKPSSSKSSSWVGHLLEAFLAQYHAAHDLQQQHQQHKREQQQQQQQQPVADQRMQRPVLPGKHLQQQQQQRWPELQQVQQQLLQEPGMQQQQQQHALSQHSLATDLSLVLYALAVMGCQPEAAWLSRWQEAMMQQLPHANAQDLSQVRAVVLRVVPGTAADVHAFCKCCWLCTHLCLVVLTCH